MNWAASKGRETASEFFFFACLVCYWLLVRVVLPHASQNIVQFVSDPHLYIRNQGFALPHKRLPEFLTNGDKMHPLPEPA